MKNYFIFKKKNTTLLFILLCFCFVAMAQKPIVIGSSAKANLPFSALDSLLTEISKGNMHGNIVLALENGKYTLRTGITVNTSKFTAADHLTITSAGKNRDSCILRSDVYGEGCITLNNARQVSIKNLSIDCPYGFGIYFAAQCEDIEISDCVLRSYLSNCNDNCINICSGKTDAAYRLKNIRILRNYLEGGYYNIRLCATAAAKQNHGQCILIDSNCCYGAQDRGITVENIDTLSITRNSILPRTACTKTYFGLYANNNLGVNIAENFISLQKASTYITQGNALQCTASDTLRKGSPSLIVNNVIIGNNGSEKANNPYNYALYAFGNIQIFHNSIYQAGNGSGCLYAGGFLTNMDIQGNQFVCAKSSQAPVYLNPKGQSYSYWTGKIKTDYNNYYSPSLHIGTYNSTTIFDLDELKDVCKGDAHSVSKPVVWDERLQLTNHASFLMPNIGISTAFNQNKRGKITEMGAYSPLSLDAELRDFGKTVFSGTDTKVYAVLTNSGTDTLKKVDIQWTLGNTLQKTFHWTGNLAMGYSDTLTLGSMSVLPGKMIRVRAWTEKPNGSGDENPHNDTILAYEYICDGSLNGKYSVSNSDPTDFYSLTETVKAIYECGISGPIVLEVRDTLKQLVISDSVKGSDAKNTITIRAAAPGSLLVDNGEDGASLILQNARYWNFDGLTIGNTADGLIGIQFKEDNHDIRFTGCNIRAKMSLSAGMDEYRCVEYCNLENTANCLRNIRFSGNRLKGGFYSFFLNNTAGMASQMDIASVYIDSNEMTDAFSGNVYCLRWGVVKSLTHNNIISSSSTDGGYHAIVSNYGSCWGNISHNRICINSDQIGYAIYIDYEDYGIDNKCGYIINNEIFVRMGDGIRINSRRGKWEIHHNSISVSGFNSTGIEIDGYNNWSARISRNLITCRDTNCTPIGFYTHILMDTCTYDFGDYNNYYSPVSYMFANSSIRETYTFSECAKNASKDFNAVCFQPLFENDTCLRLLNSSCFPCPRLKEVPEDIDGRLRSETTVIGCYHAGSINLPACKDAALKSFLPIQPNADDSVPITVVLHNNDTAPLNAAMLYCKINEKNFITCAYAPAVPLSGHQTDTVTIGRFSFESGINSVIAWVKMYNDGNHANDTIRDSVNIQTCDIQLVSITATAKAEAKTRISPSVLLANVGNTNLPYTKIHLEVIDRDGKVLQKLNETSKAAQANSTFTHKFTQSYTVPDYDGTYTLKAYVEAYPIDENQANDTLSKSFSCYIPADPSDTTDTTGIADVSVFSCHLGQNRPNPAQQLTRIPYRLPQGSRGEFSVFLANGQLIYRQIVSSETSEILLDLSDYAAGTYYYSLEYQGQRLVKKLNIRK